uniref:translation initiation factor eIF-2B subunit gamma-like n=1 Tax=Styela clava TaxID=7725 RepID=UPI0019395AA3|nr:translation initiation factor eIF-2B subunit gamma-like [Styela clava]
MVKNMEFQAVIMAGGRGDQMSDLTSSIPKPLLPIGNKPLIWYTVNTLERVGFREIIIITMNSIVNSVKQAISSLKNINADIVGISEDLDWGTTDSLRHIKDKVKCDLLVMSCDILCDFELHRLADVHRLHNTAITMLLAPARPELENVPGVKAKRKSKKPREIIGLSKAKCSKCRVVFLENEADVEEEAMSLSRSLLKQQPCIHVRTDLTDVHMYIIRKWVVDYITHNKSKRSIRGELLPYLVKKQWRKPAEVTKESEISIADPTNTTTDEIESDPRDIFSYLRQDSAIERVLNLSLKTKPLLHSGHKTEDQLSVHAYVYEAGFCMRVNTLSAFVEANRLMAKNISIIAPNVAELPLIHASVKVEEKTQIGSDSMIAEDSVIGTKVSVKRCTIGKHCVIGNQVRLTNCTILDKVVIRDGCTIQNSVICENVEIGEKSTVKDCLVGSQHVLQPGSNITNESLVESTTMMDFE